MEYPLKELEERYKKIYEPEESVEPYALPKAPQALKEYLLFIEETSPFNTIAREIREKYLGSGMAFLDKISAGTAGVIDMQMATAFVRTLHSQIVEETEKKVRAGRKDLIFYEKEGRICLLPEEKRCYPIKLESPKRFRIVKILLRARGGKSASEIAQLLDLAEKEKSVQDNIKDDINATNEKFMEKIGTEQNLILSSKPGKSNIYSLNHDDFSWVKGSEKVR